MRIARRVVSNVASVEISGKLHNAEHGDALKAVVAECISDGVPAIVIDASNLKWMSSIGLGGLLAATENARENSTRVAVVVSSERYEWLEAHWLGFAHSPGLFFTNEDEARKVVAKESDSAL
jgi:anti-anti-sigma factor